MTGVIIRIRRSTSSVHFLIKACCIPDGIRKLGTKTVTLLTMHRVIANLPIAIYLILSVRIHFPPSASPAHKRGSETMCSLGRKKLVPNLHLLTRNQSYAAGTDLT
ncbi:hypothetical protein PAXINDRAFT_169404 [Paxillus involutus ATCC 200175]|uniref:Uncharacterized protein n=1 Tax=Paxillus involutus ATCC 200175 TaxID=664439 RepID=A0A0C9TH32_PAXIN|nr:hypothetical protein PAXINDRAFT_169404 [Paxillus involutus ATCC 200175]